MIVLATQCFPPQIGGIEALMADLSFHLAAHYPWTVLTKHHPKQHTFDQQQPYHIHRFYGHKWYRQYNLKRTLKRIHTQTPVQVILTDTWKSAKTLLPVAKKLNIPVISLAHGNDVLTKDKFWRRHKIQHTLNQCHQVVAVSRATQALLNKLGIEHTSVIHNGVYTKQYAHPVKPLNLAAPQLLTVARLEPRKGQDQVIQSLVYLRTLWPHIHYHIAGLGHDIKRLKQLVYSLNLEQHVTFHGRVTYTQKKALLQHTDLFVMPVRYESRQHSIEGFGISLVEAQLMGLPVITGMTGGVTEVVQHGLTGLCCDGSNPQAVEQTITQLLKTPQQAYTLAEKGQLYAKKYFTHKVMIKQYQQLLAPFLNPILPKKDVPHAQRCD